MRTCQTWMEMDEQTKKRRTPGRKGGDEGWISQRQTEKSTLGGAAERRKRAKCDEKRK